METMWATYQGLEYKYTDLYGRSIDMTPGKEYEISIQYDGPVVIINGIQQEHPDGTYWVTIHTEDAEITMPYAKKPLERHWKISNA